MTEPERGSPFLKSIASTDFSRAYYKSFWREVLHLVTQRSNELVSFDEVRQRLPFKGQHYMGVSEVPIAAIVGSESRYQDFDRAFLPRQTHTKDRWMNVDLAHLAEVPLPPVELYKVGSMYFVRDGNHRVSVAREKGQEYIDAVVIEFDVLVPVGEGLSLNELILRQEQAHFFDLTHLTELRPGGQVELTLPGQYEKLIDHINTKGWYEGIEKKAPVPYIEAVTAWYDQVYQPLIEIIRERQILKEFPHRTEADLYLWIIEHRHYLDEEYTGEVSLEEAATHFAGQYSQRPLRKLERWLRTIWQAVSAPLRKH